MDAGIFLDEFRPFRRGEIAPARRARVEPGFLPGREVLEALFERHGLAGLVDRALTTRLIPARYTWGAIESGRRLGREAVRRDRRPDPHPARAGPPVVGPRRGPADERVH
jgi:hypothetical protein